MGNNGEIKKEEPQAVVLTIILNSNGTVSINGPIQNRLLCYGLLKMAEEALVDFKNSQKVNLVKPTSNDIADLLKRR